MKIWIKVLAGIILGVLIAFFVPLQTGASEALRTLSDILIQMARYAAFPLVFFSLVIGTYTLKLEKQLLKVHGNTILYLLATTVILALVGLGSVLLFAPRIPIVTVSVEAPSVPSFVETVNDVFPANLFQVLVTPGNLMLPLVIFAIVLGANLSFDRVITRPIVQLGDSLSRVFYHVNSLVVELLWIAAVPIAASMVVRLRVVENLAIYKELLLILGIDTLFVIFAIYPVLLYLLDKESNPFKILYAGLASALAGLVTGNEYVAVGFLVKQGKENLGVPRTVGSAVYPVFAVFGRAGTAMVSSISFYLILNSLLPSADIDGAKILFVFGFSILASLALGSVPGLGAYVSITILSRQFDAFWPTFGLLEHYKILEPIKLILVSLSVMLDVITAHLASYMVSRNGSWLSVKEARDFV